MRQYLLILIAIFTLASCSKDDSFTEPEIPVVPALQAATHLDQSYGSDGKQKMDIYLPAGRSAEKTKVIFLIHGGAWIEGDKADFKDVVDTLKKRLPDYAVVNINYRLADVFTLSNRFPTQENDIKAAIQSIYNKREQFAISDKWVYIGASAGAHLALLQGYKHLTPIAPKAIVNYFGPTDMNDMMNNPGTDSPGAFVLSLLFNGTATQSSPVTFVTSTSAPTLSFQGDKDQLVLPRQQTILHNKLKASNVPEKLEIFANEEHGFTEATMTKSFDMIKVFLDIHVK